MQAKIDCAECKEIWEKKWHSVPDCSVCDYPGLWPENLEAYNVILEGGRALVDHRGNINLSGARLVCETLGYTWDSFMMRKIIRALTAQAEFYEKEIRQEVASRQQDHG